MDLNKWPKAIPPLTQTQQIINDDFMRYWHEILSKHLKYRLIENFNHGYPVKHAPLSFKRTLEIGAGLGEHLKYETLDHEQKQNYICLDLRKNMIEQIKLRYPTVEVLIGDCQESLPFQENYFDRILAIHVLEHLPNLPAALKEMYRLCNKQSGIFSVVIPCEGGSIYTLARRISTQRIFEKRYKQPYKWLIEREHVNTPAEIISEIKKFFKIKHLTYFPFKIPFIHINLCLGLTLIPKNLLSADYRLLNACLKIHE